MTHPPIDKDLTFTHADSLVILKDYVCAVCLSDLAVVEIKNSERIFIVCPVHANVCLTGRVMRSTASMRVEQSHRDYYPFIASMPDLFSPIWANGVPAPIAEDIQRRCVCALCGDDLILSRIRDQYSHKVEGIFTLICRSGHGNVGTNGIGFTRKHEYEFIPPVKWRAFLRSRADAPQSESFFYQAESESASFERLGVVSYGVRPELKGTVDEPDHFQVVFFGKQDGYSDRFRKLYGKEPKRLSVRIPTSTVQTSLDCYFKGALTARAVRDGSGWRWDYFRDPDTHEIDLRGGNPVTVSGLRRQSAGVHESEPIVVTSKGKAIYLQQTARLRFVMPDLAVINHKPIPGFFEMSFRGDDASRIEEGVKHIKEECFAGGRMLPEVALSLSLCKNETGYFVTLEKEK